MSRRQPRMCVVEPEARGGLLHYAVQLCRALGRHDLDVELVTAKRAEVPGGPDGFRIVPLLDLWDPKPAPGAARPSRLRRVLRGLRHYREWARLLLHVARTRPDVVQLGDLRFAADAIPVIALRRLCPCLLDVCHNVEPFRAAGAASRFHAGPIERLLYRLAYRRFDRVFVHHEINRVRFLERFPVDPARVRVIVHGNQELLREIDDGTPAAHLRRELGIAEGAPVVLFAGTLTAYKGVDLLLRAAAQVDAARDCHWVVAGYPLRDFDLDAHRRLADELGIGDRLRIVPRFLEDRELGAWMRLADVVALPYREGFQSGVLLLAQTFGVPVVAARVGSFPETIEDGVDGLLHEPGDPGSLATALERVLGDEVLRYRLGREGRRRALGRHSWARVAATIAGEVRVLLRASGERRLHGARREETFR